MKRIRQVVTTVHIIKAGQWNLSQIKLPKNITRIVGVETDVFCKSIVNKENYLLDDLHREMFSVTGKLSLQTFDTVNIFFTDWVKAPVFYEDIKNQTAFKVYPFRKHIRGKTQAKRVDVDATESTTINAYYYDTLGKIIQKDIAYDVKISIWIETSEDANGLVFEFLNDTST